MKLQVLSVQPMSFKGDDGKERNMYRVYCADATGAVGSVYSNKPVSIGDTVVLTVYVNKDGKFSVRIAN